MDSLEKVLHCCYSVAIVAMHACSLKVFFCLLLMQKLASARGRYNCSLVEFA